MSSVDDRIVNMYFNSKQFTQGASDAQKTLLNLQITLANTARATDLGTVKLSSKGVTTATTESQRALSGLQTAISNTAKHTGLSEVSGSIGSATTGMTQLQGSGVSAFTAMGMSVGETTSRLSAMRIAGVTAIATIASKATMAGLNLLKSMTLDPISAGFHEYETNLNSIQTIIANTGAELPQVNRYLEELNLYSDKTIYNFSQMASAIGRFTAAGVKLDPATDAIKGMANTAALTGATAEQLNSAMYQMSQALSTGTIRLMDWNSLNNANMGTKNVREALMATNRTLDDHGQLLDESMAQYDNFRDSLTTGWLTAKTFTKTMKVMAGQTIENRKDLKKLGMTQEEFTKKGHKFGDTVAFSVEQLQKMGYAKDAAKDISELSQSSIESATKVKTFTQAIDVVKESIGSGWAKIFQNLFGDFEQSKKLWTGVTETITGAIGKIFDSVNQLLVSWRNAGGYAALWAGFGNIFQAIGNILSPFVIAFKSLFPTAKSGGSALADLTIKFEEVTAWIEKMTSYTSLLTPILLSVFGVFGQIGSVAGAVVSGLSPLVPIITSIAAAAGDLAQQGAEMAANLISGLTAGLDVGKIQAAVTNFAEQMIAWFKEVFGIHSPSTVMAEVGGNIVAGLVEGIVKGFGLVMQSITTVVGIIFDSVKSLFGNMDALDFASLLNAIFAGGLFLALRQGVKGVASIKEILGSLNMVLGEVQNSFKAWQKSLQAKMILDIAIAIGILVAAMVALSFLKPKEIAQGIWGITALMATLTSALFAMSQIPEAKFVSMSAALVLISAAMIQLTGAIMILGKADPADVGKGIGFMAASLAVLTGAMLGFSLIKGSIEGYASSILIISIAMNALATAVLAFALIPMDALEQGLGGMGVALGMLVLAMQGLDKMEGTTEGLAASILIIAIAMNLLAAAVLAFGLIPIKALYQGLSAMGIVIIMLVTALGVMSANSEGVLAAAGSMLMMAVAMNLLVGVIITLGAAPWEVVVRGIGLMALALGVLLLAALGAQQVALGLGILSSAILYLGAGLFLAGAGMALFAAGLATLVALGGAGIAMMGAAIGAFIALLPQIAIQVAAAFVSFIEAIAEATPRIHDAILKIVVSMIDTVREAIPEFRKLISALIKAGIDVIKHGIPQYVEMGFTIIDKFLKSAEKHIPSIVDSAIGLITKFIDTVAANLDDLADSAAKLIIAYIQAVADAINNNVDDLRAAGLDLAHAILNGMTGGLLDEGLQMVKDAAQKLADALPKWMKKVLGIESPSKVMRDEVGVMVARGTAEGIIAGARHAVAAVIKMAQDIIAAGVKEVEAAQRKLNGVTTKYYRAQAAADMAREKAKAAAKKARDEKNNKAAQKHAEDLQKEADKLQKQADKKKQDVTAAQNRVDDAQAYAEADTAGKASIKKDLAVTLADRANKMLQRANEEAAQAKEMAKKGLEGAEAMRKAAEKSAEAAQKLADKARQANKEANELYRKSVEDRIKAIQKAAEAEKKARADQEAYDAADANGKSDILKSRAAKDEARSKALAAKAEELIKKARKWATIDAEKAQKYLDAAEAATKASQDAADKAKEEAQQAEDVLTQGSSGGSDPSNLQPSRSVLEDAAKAVDRYTQSLQDAAALAAAPSGPVQFIQNNYSPDALNAGEIYRQGKNLVSAAEVKMGANSGTP
jgi:hypothetical protein